MPADTPAQSNLKSFVQRWLITTLAVLVATKVVSGIHYDTPTSLVVSSLVLGLLNAFLRPVMLLVSLPLLLFTLGLFTFVINALVLWLVSFLLRPHFYVDTFWVAFKGALVISLVTLLLNALTGTGRFKVQVSRGKKPPPPSPKDEGGGPIIDV
ncbi:MAG: phage holin family protein [Chloroflexi bacterium]|nr:phage holin family protein [Chloroflexota bacterium]